MNWKFVNVNYFILHEIQPDEKIHNNEECNFDKSSSFEKSSLG